MSMNMAMSRAMNSTVSRAMSIAISRTMSRAMSRPACTMQKGDTYMYTMSEIGPVVTLVSHAQKG